MFKIKGQITSSLPNGSWHVLNGQGKWNNKWGSFGEIQFRSHELFNKYFYYEVKGGASYNVDKNSAALIGLGSYNTYPEEGFVNQSPSIREFRIWEQFTLKNYLELIKFEHRYRIEQRWFTTGFANRFRYRLNFVIPLAKDHKIEKGDSFISFFNEIFLIDTAPYFQQNRAYFGYGYQMTENWGFQLGYQNQFVAIGNPFVRNIFSTSLLYKFERKNQKLDSNPTSD
jgi:hypothetical protein